MPLLDWDCRPWYNDYIVVLGRGLWKPTVRSLRRNLGAEFRRSLVEQRILLGQIGKIGV